MKNACIVFKKNKDVISDCGYAAITETFCLNGYALDEIRILPLLDAEKARVSLLELGRGYQNLVIMTDKESLAVAKNYLNATFPDAIYQGGINGAGIYTSGERTYFLLSVDYMETGVDYVKNTCLPYLHKKTGVRFDKSVIRAVGVNEMHVQRLLYEAQNLVADKITFQHKRKYGEDHIRFFYDSNTSKMLIDDTVRLFAEGLGESIYALEDISLEEQLVRILKLRGKKLSVAESFTGGGIGRRIVSVSGASSVYFEGLNTYDELSKRKRLGVSDFTLKTQGAASDQTAYEMAAGLIATGDCDLAIATTGIAGPKSDRSLLPVGLCYIAVGTKEKILVYRYQFDGNREEITETAINYALFLAYKQLKDY